jgi:excisionase family DNA binding protein
MSDHLLTILDVAEQLQLKPKTVHQLVRDGKLACVQLTPRERRFLPDHVQEFIRSKTVPVPKPLDPGSQDKLRYSQKGGNRSVSTRVSGAGLLKEEIKKLCR